MKYSYQGVNVFFAQNVAYCFQFIKTAKETCHIGF